MDLCNLKFLISSGLFIYSKPREFRIITAQFGSGADA
jgi:hypothetical protein